MSLQVLPPAETFAAVVAEVRLLARVDSLVFLQIARLREAASALHAAVRFLPRVAALVDPQVPHSAERLPANDADVDVLGLEIADVASRQIKRKPVCSRKQIIVRFRHSNRRIRKGRPRYVSSVLCSRFVSGRLLRGVVAQIYTGGQVFTRR